MQLLQSFSPLLPPWRSRCAAGGCGRRCAEEAWRQRRATAPSMPAFAARVRPAPTPLAARLPSPCSQDNIDIYVLAYAVMLGASAGACARPVGCELPGRCSQELASHALSPLPPFLPLLPVQCSRLRLATRWAGGAGLGSCAGYLPARSSHRRRPCAAAACPGRARPCYPPLLPTPAPAAAPLPPPLQTNLMVLGAGGYRNLDFIKFGGPMQLFMVRRSLRCSRCSVRASGRASWRASGSLSRCRAAAAAARRQPRRPTQ